MGWAREPSAATRQCSTFERRLCRRNESWGEVSEGGRSPPPRRCGVGALGRTLNVQEVRLACGRRAPPCSWTLLIALARAFLRQAPSPHLFLEKCPPAAARRPRSWARRPHC